jgi:hypothetical protein
MGVRYHINEFISVYIGVFLIFEESINEKLLDRKAVKAPIEIQIIVTNFIEKGIKGSEIIGGSIQFNIEPL